jgi:cytochrome P450
MFENVFSDEMRRNPYPFYNQHRASGVLHLEPLDLWLVFSYDGVKSILENNSAFSSAAIAPKSTGKPLNWLIFKDSPRHGRLRALISSAFIPRVIVNLEPRIREISQELLNAKSHWGEMDLATDYAIPLPLMVIAEMLGITTREYPRLRQWSDAILDLAHTVTQSAEAARAVEVYARTTAEMDSYLHDVLDDRHALPKDDLLTRLATVCVEGEQLTHSEILGFFQLLLLAGSETTTNLINNAMICLLEHPGQLATLQQRPQLMATTIEEVLRYRSPLQAVFRKTTRSIELHGTRIRAGKLVLPMIGAANRDPGHFERADSFDLARSPNPHLSFGHGIHFCLGAALSRLEAKIALTDLLERLDNIEFAQAGPWEPRAAFHVLGPARLPIRFTANHTAGVLTGEDSGHGCPEHCQKFGQAEHSPLTSFAPDVNRVEN